MNAWCAVNRLIATGEVIGSNEYLCVYSALKAITLGAAYTLKLDGEIGSIEAGRWADFAIFDEDPLTGKPADQENIRIAGTIIAGGAFDA